MTFNHLILVLNRLLPRRRLWWIGAWPPSKSQRATKVASRRDVGAVIDGLRTARNHTAGGLMNGLGYWLSGISRKVKAGRPVPARQWNVGRRKGTCLEKGRGRRVESGLAASRSGVSRLDRDSSPAPGGCPFSRQVGPHGVVVRYSPYLPICYLLRWKNPGLQFRRGVSPFGGEVSAEYRFHLTCLIRPFSAFPPPVAEGEVRVPVPGGAHGSPASFSTKRNLWAPASWLSGVAALRQVDGDDGMGHHGEVVARCLEANLGRMWVHRHTLHESGPARCSTTPIGYPDCHEPPGHTVCVRSKPASSTGG
jgi:hypothetical protein